jgi:hypothetical protein
MITPFALITEPQSEPITYTWLAITCVGIILSLIGLIYWLTARRIDHSDETIKETDAAVNKRIDEKFETLSERVIDVERGGLKRAENVWREINDLKKEDTSLKVEIATLTGLVKGLPKSEDLDKKFDKLEEKLTKTITDKFDLLYRMAGVKSDK